MPYHRKKQRITSTILGSSISYSETKGCYTRGKSFVNFENNGTRVYDVGEAFLKGCIVFEILSENGRILTLGNPRYANGGPPDKGVQLLWVLSKFDRKVTKQCSENDLSRILSRCRENCDAACLKGIEYRNKYQDTCTIHIDGPSTREICAVMEQEPRELYVRAADILNARFKGHRQNGDSVIRVSKIPPEDMEAYKVLFKEKIMRLQKVDNKEFLITKEVDRDEDTLVKALHELSRRYDSIQIEVKNEDSDNEHCEHLIDEQLDACNISMNNPVSFLCGYPGTGKTSALCKILKASKGSIILTPSHVSRNVVHQRALRNGVDPNSFSVEVTAFAVRHIQEWLTEDDSGVHTISQRSIDFMSKFKKENGAFEIETLVIEEASMVDLFQASRVIDQIYSIPSVKRVVFCGDHRQLPSISKGRILQDIMECTSIPGTILKVNHRSRSALSDNLRYILTSSALHIEEDDTFEVLSASPNECEIETDNYGRDRVMAIQKIIDIYMHHYENDQPLHVFAYTNIEVAKLNEAIRTSVFGDTPELFPVGCKVKVCDPDIIVPPLFHRNDFLEIVENKDSKNYVVKRWTGRVTQEDEIEETFDIRVTGRIKEALSLGYASSIHAYQGSECEYVVIHAIYNCAYFSRDALYTAVSRGKRKCFVVTVDDKRKDWKKIMYKRSTDRLSNLSVRF